jgi:hypothetical protein
VFFDYSGSVAAKWFRRFRYTRAVTWSALLFAIGLVFAALLSESYLRHDFRLPEHSATNHLGVMGLLLMIAGFMSFTFTLILHATAVAVRRR